MSIYTIKYLRKYSNQFHCIDITPISDSINSLITHFAKQTRVAHRIHK